VTELVRLLQGGGDELERALLLSVKRAVPGRSGLQDTALVLGLAAPTAKALADALVGAESLGRAASIHSISSLGASGVASVSGVASASGALTASAPMGGLGAPASIATLIAKYLTGGALLSFLAIATLDRALSAGSSVAPAQSVPLAAPSLGSEVKPLGAVQAQPPPAESLTPPAAVEQTDRGASHATAAYAPVRNPSKPLPKREGAFGHATPAASATDAASVAPLAEPRPLLPVTAARAAAPSASAPINTSLADEIHLLDLVRAALAQGNADGARRLLDQYAANRPSGILAQEADLLRVRMFLKLGDRPAAAALAQQIIRRNPESSHVASLRDLLAD
jgi:hypothetical protein